MREHENNSFITLTFDDEKLKDPLQNVTLIKKDFQLFMKRLRKNTKNKIRYFHCGEYGEKFSRPHHHAILFGYDFEDKVEDEPSKKGLKQWVSNTLDKAWQNQGRAVIGEANFETSAYVARYCLKKLNGVGAEDYYNGRQPEYTTMSRRPGIGATYFDKYKEETYRDDYIILRDKKVRPPKFYDRLLEATPGGAEKLEQIKINRFKSASKHEDYNDLTRLYEKELYTELTQLAKKER